MQIYGRNAANHYAAYRPPLHQTVLAEALGGQQFETALDVGCGTGWSSVALAGFCDSVIGVDESESMLAAALSHPKVDYRHGDGTVLPIGDEAIDLVTIAGALPYLNITDFVRELKRVCRPSATIVPYDFCVDLDELMQLFSLNRDSNSEAYDHSLNLAEGPRVETLKAVSRRVRFKVDASHAAHILLSSDKRFRVLSESLGTADPFDHVREEISGYTWAGQLTATIWYAVHLLH